MPDRRQFLGTTAMTLVAAHFGALLPADSDGEAPRLLTALDRATGWVNTPPIPPASLTGKVVLVQFGTYTCINWLRTLPYIRAWAQRYGPALAMVAVHTPEFAFERNLENVRRSMQQMKIDFPLAIDNDYGIWRAFDNHYWPAAYLIDARGRLRDRQFGEGEYERLERSIQRLLGESGVKTSGQGFGPVAASGVEMAADWNNLRSPELYLGYDRSQNFSSTESARRGRSRPYSAPASLRLNHWALSGEWTVANEASALEKPHGRLTCRFHARDVHLVMGPRRREAPVRFRITVDGQPPAAASGLDLDAQGIGMVIDQRMYQLVRQSGPIADRTFEIEFLDPGVEIFAFTFG